jgi:hypothetical protein
LILPDHKAVLGCLIIEIKVVVGCGVPAVVFIYIDCLCGGSIGRGVCFLYGRCVFLRFGLVLLGLTGREINIIEKFFLSHHAGGYSKHQDQGCKFHTSHFHISLFY